MLLAFTCVLLKVNSPPFSTVHSLSLIIKEEGANVIFTLSARVSTYAFNVALLNVLPALVLIFTSEMLLYDLKTTLVDGRCRLSFNLISSAVNFVYNVSR